MLELDYFRTTQNFHFPFQKVFEHSEYSSNS